MLNICSICVYFQLVYIYVIESCFCNIKLLYCSTYVLYVQKIVVVVSISEYIFYLFKKHCDKIV
jgi:hypothetical protein